MLLFFVGPLSTPDIRGQDHRHAAGADAGSVARAAGERGRTAAESARGHGSHSHASLRGNTRYVHNTFDKLHIFC